MNKRDKVFKRLKRIQEVAANFEDMSIKMPRIAVVGPQSSGKSSILEQIVQREILPKGPNLVTRCPILINIRPTRGDEYAQFSDKIVYLNGGDIKEEVRKRMNCICGDDQAVSSTELIIFLYLKSTLFLTLVDLPGLTKIPKGNQPADIESLIERLVMNYISNPNTFILAIINANVDIANSESLKIAHKCDVEGVRTLGVVTKIDLMDNGTDCLDILENISYPLKNGYVGVVNRTQTQIVDKLSFKDAIRHEDSFFAKSVYKGIASANGSKVLVKRLYEIFLDLVNVEIPNIEKYIDDKIGNLENELLEIGDPISFETVSKLDIAINYSRVVSGLIDDARHNNRYFSIDSDYNMILFLRRSFNFDYVSLNIEQFVMEEMEFCNVLFLSEKIFKNAFIRKANHLKLEVDKLLEGFANSFMNSVNKFECKSSKRLVNILNIKTKQVIGQQLTEVKKVLGKFVDIECSFMNFNHPNFSSGERIMSFIGKSHNTWKTPYNHEMWGIFAGGKKPNKTTNEIEKTLLVGLVDDYFTIFRTKYLDLAIKGSYYYFLEFVKENIQSMSLETLDKIDFNELEENSSILDKRNAVEDSINSLKNLKNELNETIATKDS